MLINCPECNKEVSDKSHNCIHCGFPLQNTTNENICTINGIKYDLSNLLPLVLLNNDKVKTLIKIRQECNLQIRDATNLYDSILSTGKIPETFTCETITVSNNIPKCPTCNSTNLSKISTMSKAGSVAMWGLLSQKVKKTWHCNSCEYEW